MSVETVPFDRSLLSDPRNGWAAAIYDATPKEWRVGRSAAGASSDEGYAAIAPRMHGTALVALVHARTLDVTSAAPFRRGRWVFAHSGALDDTDGAFLFGYFLVRLDEAGVDDATPVPEIDIVIAKAVDELFDHRVAKTSFVLSNGVTLYAHRNGPAIHLVERDHGPRKMSVASEPLTDEPWSALDDGTLLRCARVGSSALDLVFLCGSDPRHQTRKSDVELPFTD